MAVRLCIARRVRCVEKDCGVSVMAARYVWAWCGGAGRVASHGRGMGVCCAYPLPHPMFISSGGPGTAPARVAHRSDARKGDAPVQTGHTRRQLKITCVTDIPPKQTPKQTPDSRS